MLVVKNINCFMKSYKEIKRIYKMSFPQIERFPVLLLGILTLKSNVYALAFFDQERVVGFSYFFVNDETVFILYLATNDRVRSKGYGTQMVNYIKENFRNREIFLDVEAPDEEASNKEQREKRIEFYLKNQIYETNNFFEYDGVRYEILCTNQNFTEENYVKNLKGFFRIFKNKKMKSTLR